MLLAIIAKLQGFIHKLFNKLSKSYHVRSADQTLGQSDVRWEKRPTQETTLRRFSQNTLVKPFTIIIISRSTVIYVITYFTNDRDQGDVEGESKSVIRQSTFWLVQNNRNSPNLQGTHRPSSAQNVSRCRILETPKKTPYQLSVI